MPAPVLYRKWRPQTLAQVVGQEHVTRTLLNALTAGKLSHAYLFTGPRGTGKTSTARILAKAVNCQVNGRGEPCDACPMCVAIAEGRAMDVVEIDAASNNSVENVRDLRDKIGMAPTEGRYRVYIVDEVHMLSTSAFNALLKTLEEPPPHALFVLATTEVHKVPATVLSRCQRFDFHRIPQQALAAHLRRICETEGIAFEPEALDLIARSAAGGARDAVSLLEQAEVSYGGRITLEAAQDLLGVSGDPRAVGLVRCIAQGDLTTGMQLIQQVRDDGMNLPQFGKEVAGHLRSLLLLKAQVPGALDVPAELGQELRALAAGMPLELVTRALKVFGQLDFRADAASSLPLELALVDCTLPAAAPAPPAEQPAARSAASTAARQAAAAPSVPRTEARPPRPEPMATPPAPAPATGQSAEPPGAPAMATGAATSVEEVRAILQRVQTPKVRFIEALVKSPHCSVHAVEGTTITLSFRSDFKAHKDRLEQEANRRALEQGIKEACGIDYRVRVVLVDNGPVGQKEAPNGGASGQPRGGHLVRAALDAGARPRPTGF